MNRSGVATSLLFFGHRFSNSPLKFPGALILRENRCEIRAAKK